MPIKSVADFVSKAVETLASNPYPEFTKRNYYVRFVGDEMELTTIYDIEDDRVEEGLMDIDGRAYPFFLSLEGLKGEIYPVFSLEQLFAVIDQSTPSA